MGAHWMPLGILGSGVEGDSVAMISPWQKRLAACLREVPSSAFLSRGVLERVLGTLRIVRFSL